MFHILGILALVLSAFIGGCMFAEHERMTNTEGSTFGDVLVFGSLFIIVILMIILAIRGAIV